MEKAEKREIDNQKQPFYEFVLDACDNGLIFVDATGKMIAYNRVMEEIEGHSREEVLGRTMKEVYQISEDDSMSMKVIRTHREVTNVHNLFTSLKGRKIQLLSNYYPVFRGEEFCGVCVVSTNQNMLQTLLDKSYNLDINGFKRPLYVYHDIKGSSPKLLSAVEEAKVAASTNSNIMLLGETGVGKEMFVQSIHSGGPFHSKPFVPINCSAIPENLLEGLLFGTTKGAFTGAENKAGLIEQAGQGTLYLDELNSMPIALQVKLLRVIQERKVQRLGGKDSIETDCRFIASINEDPLNAIEAGRLRKDLFYRLSTIIIEIPSLSSRLEDIPLLASHFLLQANKKYHLSCQNFSSDLLELFCRYNWPGNIRELQHVVENTAVLSRDADCLDISHLNSYNKRTLLPFMNKRQIEIREPDNLHDILLNAEKSAVSNALESTNRNVTQAAKILGISRQNLNYRMRKLFGEEK